jgi:hypothetical protein
MKFKFELQPCHEIKYCFSHAMKSNTGKNHETKCQGNGFELNKIVYYKKDQS